MWAQAAEVLNQSMSRIVVSIASFLPGLLVLVLVLILSTVLAWVARAVLRRSLQSVGFDRRMRYWGFHELIEWSPSGSPAMLAAQVVYWAIILFGLLVGLSALDASLISVLVMRLVDYLPNVVAAALILIVGMLIARFVSRSVLISAVNMQIQSARLLSLGVKWLMMVLAGAMALEHLGIGGQIVRLSFGILFGGIVLALSLAVGLGSKDIVRNSLERQTERNEEQNSYEEFPHL